MKTQQLNWKEFLFQTVKGQLLLVGLAIAVTYLITEHTTHVIQVLPYGLFLLCPISMMFMHGGHGNHDSDHGGDSTGQDDNSSKPPQGHIH